MSHSVALLWSLDRSHAFPEAIQKTHTDNLCTRSNLSIFTQMRMFVAMNVTLTTTRPWPWRHFGVCVHKMADPSREEEQVTLLGEEGLMAGGQALKLGYAGLHHRSRRVSTSPPEVEACHRALLFLQCLYWDADSGVYRSPLRQALESAGLKYNSTLWLFVWCHDSFV